jgi:hypothetical protein
MAHSIESLSRNSTGHASVAYNSVGRHLFEGKARTTSSDAALPIILYRAVRVGDVHEKTNIWIN